MADLSVWDRKHLERLAADLTAEALRLRDDNAQLRAERDAYKADAATLGDLSLRVVRAFPDDAVPVIARLEAENARLAAERDQWRIAADDSAYEALVDHADRECHAFLEEIGRRHGKPVCTYGDGPEFVVKEARRLAAENDRLKLENERLRGRLWKPAGAPAEGGTR